MFRRVACCSAVALDWQLRGLFLGQRIPSHSQACSRDARGVTLRGMNEPPRIETQRHMKMQARRRVPFPLIFAFSLLCAAVVIGGVFALALRSVGKL